MALCLADSLVARDALDPGDLMDRFRAWRDNGHNSVTGDCFDIGNTTSAAISRYIRTGDPLAGDTDPDSAGNGAIMRLAPVPIRYRHDLAQAEAAAVLQSRTTHGALECLESCRLMTQVLVRLLGGAAWQEAVSLDAGQFDGPRVQALAQGRWKAKTRKQIRSSGYVIDTLEAALWAVHSTASFREAVLLAANLGGDADTVGAVTGQLAGARYGLAGIPPTWLDVLAWREELMARVRQLMGVATASVSSPR
jgi:ADP-ribosyl-[dinitrogen reductase] hydrolase